MNSHCGILRDFFSHPRRFFVMGIRSLQVRQVHDANGLPIYQQRYTQQRTRVGLFSIRKCVRGFHILNPLGFSRSGHTPGYSRTNFEPNTWHLTEINTVLYGRIGQARHELHDQFLSLGLQQHQRAFICTRMPSGTF